jgi:hypothetical protein
LAWSLMTRMIVCVLICGSLLRPLSEDQLVVMVQFLYFN